MYPKNSIELLRSQRRKELDFVYKKKKSIAELVAKVKEQLEAERLCRSAILQRDRRMRESEAKFVKAIMEAGIYG